MAVSYERFVIGYPEFRQADRLLVERKLALALRMTNISVWTSVQDIGIELLAAHLLSVSPLGETARLSVDDLDQTPYGQERKRLAQSVCCGLGRVI